MVQRPARFLIYAGFSLVILLILGRVGVVLYADVLWFNDLGYDHVLWRRITAVAVLRAVTAALGAGIVLLNLGRVVRHLGPVQLRRRYGNLEIAEQIPHGYVATGIVVASLLAGWWLSGLAFPADVASSALAWWYREPWGVSDPQFRHDLSFYVFTFPFLVRTVDFLLLVTVWSAVLCFVGYVLVGAVRLRGGRFEVENQPKFHFAIIVAGLVLLFGARYWLSIYGLLLDGRGFADSIGYTDVNARIPAYRILAVISVLAAAGLVYSAVRQNWLPAVAAVGVLLLAGVALGIAYPSLIQKLRVVPNELDRENLYIGWNIEFTRRGWGLEELERKPYAVEPGRTPVAAELTDVLRHLPLWDPEPLQTQFKQRESLAGYYDFPGVYFDRYGPPEEAIQVAVAVREFTEEGLPANSRTWSTIHLNANQARGNGAVAAPVSDKTVEGNPIIWPLSAAPRRDSLAVTTRISREVPREMLLSRPSVYFGQRPQEFLILNPGDSLPDNDVMRAAGIPLSSFFRVFVFAWRFSDRNLLFGDLTSESRLIYRRSVGERLRTIAPFIRWDSLAYPIISDGRIVWLADGYTVSATFPISRAMSLATGGVGGVRYVRNSVKATVDALTGDVQMYVILPDEPIAAAYSRAFPGLLRPLDEMPESIREHLRYPLHLLQLQANILEEYHVDSPAAFFAGQNAWQIPQEPSAVGDGRDYAPVYMMARPPGDARPSFLLVMPFIARERQHMTAILAVANDGDRYGQMTLLELPRDHQVAGPRQVRTIIEQDPVISSQLSLWRQGGSEVEIGRLRVVPLEQSVFYVQPIFLSSSGSSIPQLQRLVVSDGTSVAMGVTLYDAVSALLGYVESTEPFAEHPEDAEMSWARRALDLMEAADQAVRNGNWQEFGRKWTELQDLLRRTVGSQR